MHDLVLRNGLVIDGSGAPGGHADVAVTGGRVTEVGRVEGTTRREVDVDGLVVAPGFVDPHTHYDCQLSWDPLATPSSDHGFTTVIGGNCGFTMAPVAEGDEDYLTRLMARVEGIPLEALQEGLDWTWSSFGEWLDQLEGGLGVNAGFLVGHSAIRRFVMGEASGRAATPTQIDHMAVVLEGALTAGALGFSTSQSRTHLDGDGNPVPSAAASREELLTLAACVGRHEGTWLEAIVSGCLDGFTDDDLELLTDLSLAAGRTLNWNLLSISPSEPEKHRRQLEAGDHARASGGDVVALTMPTLSGFRFSLLTHCALFTIPGWGAVLGKPVSERIAALSDPETRRRMRASAASPEAGMIGQLVERFERMDFGETHAPGTEALAGVNVGEAARAAGADPFEFALDVIVANRLETPLWLFPDASEDADDWRLRAEVWRDDRVLVGGSDAGAHLDRMCEAHYAAVLLGEMVRERELLSLEEAVRLVTDAPARAFGLRDRGRIAPGAAGDLVVLDPARIGSGPLRSVDDLPGGASRLHREAEGIHRVLVNGVEVLVDGEPTGETPGTLLRSGTHTETVAPRSLTTATP